MAFHIPLHFEDLTRPAASPWQADPSSLRNHQPDSLIQLLEHELQQVLHFPPHQHFNALYTLIARYQSLKQEQRRSLVALLERLPRFLDTNDPNHVKLVLCFTAGLAAVASAASCKTFDKHGREALLESAYSLVSSLSTPCPFSDQDRDQLSAQLVRMTLHVLEVPSAARNKNTRPILARCLAEALSLDQRQILPASTALLHALNRYEHLPVPLADILTRLTQIGKPHKNFVVQFVREIAALSSDTLAHDVLAARSMAAFYSDLSERLPGVFRTNLALVLSQLDGDSYMMRNGIVHVIGALIRADPNAEDPLLDVLLERAHRDINAFTRSKALQTWSTLAEAKAIPNRFYPELAEIAASRLDDKAAAVRKAAAHLLLSLLANNPFGPVLRKSHFQQKLDSLQNTCSSDAVNESSTAERLSEAETEPEERNESENEREKSISEADEIHSKSGGDGSPSGVNGPEVCNEELEAKEEEGDTENQGKSLEYRYYSTAVGFIHCVENGLETVYNMLRSKSITDVSEGVSLLITAIQFQLESASGRAVRKMLPLVLAREANVRQSAIQAYVKLLAPGGVDTVDDKEPAMAVAKGLIALGTGATTGELTCLESLVNSLCRSGEANIVSPAVIAVLWDTFAGRVPGASDDQRRSACMLIGMVATEKPESLQQRVQTMESIGLENPRFARWACIAFCKLPPDSDPDNRVSLRLSHLAKTSKDLPTVEQAITAIFSVSSEPEGVVGEIVRALAKGLYSTVSKVDVTDLSRFLIVVGQVAVKELVRIEDLVSEIKRGISRQARNDGNTEEEEQATAQADKALEVAERELVSPASLLGRYGNLATKLAIDKNAPPQLQATAVLCMAKLMCVEESFCEKNLRVLFSILSSSSEPSVRSNTVTALGDLAFRFPNLVEPWSSHIYAALRDDNTKVRKNTLMALTHLILNDMIKVKGQIVGLAICILDANERIVDLARLFFHELARKSVNAIYNILPDTISCMSQMEDLTSEDFKKITSFLVGLMDKERHSDGMVEKLCHRFRTAESERETRDLAYCISILNMSERGLRKLADNFKCYSAALCDDVVHTCFVTAISKGKKAGNSQSCTQTMDELSRKIDTARSAANDSEASPRARKSLGEKADPLPTASEKHTEQRRTRARSSRKSLVSHENTRPHDGEDSESGDPEEESITTPVSQKAVHTARARKRGKKKTVVEEATSEEGSEEPESEEIGTEETDDDGDDESDEE